jgi:esterase/lipase superfamily enzyme
LESPSIWKLQFREDPEKHIVLLSIVPKERGQYFQELGTQIRTSSGKNTFVFIHGYNVTFEDAARRTAQIAYDLGFDGAPILYSWPSQGTFAGYPIDETNIEWTQANLKRFLDDLVVHTTTDNIYLIAHSMGNRAIVRALSALVSDNPSLRHRFRSVILTAPDIDADIFKRDIVPQIIGSSSSVTLYASTEDKALLAAKKFHGYPQGRRCWPWAHLGSRN